MPASDELHVALIGCGYWGRNHARVLNSLTKNLTFCDSNPELLNGISDLYSGHKTTRDADDVFSDSSVDAVVIAAPAVTHFDLASRALNAGKHVLVEKPLALDAAEGEALVQLANKSGLVLMVGHLLRYHPAVRKLKEMVSSGALGTVRYMYSNRLNLGKVRREENALWSFAPHDISVMLYLADAFPVAVSSTGGHYLQADVADVSLSALEFPGGVRGHVFVSWLHPFKEQRLVVVGSESMAQFDDLQESERKLSLYRGDVSFTNGQFVTRRGDPEPVEIDTYEPLAEEDKHFLEAVASGSAVDTDGEEGVRVLTVLRACQESLDQGGTSIALKLSGQTSHA